MRLLLALFTAVACLAIERVGITASRDLTLDDAVAMALRDNLDVRVERDNVSSARQAENGARGFYDPVFHAGSQFQVLNTPSPSVLSGEAGNLAEHDFTGSAGVRQRSIQGSLFDITVDGGRTSTNNPFIGLNPYYTSQLKLEWTQPLLRGRTIDADRATMKIRAVQTGLARTQLELRAIDIVTRVEQAYWDLAAARDSAAVNREAADLARTQLAQNRRMIAAGSLAAVELSASEAELQRRLDNWYASLDIITTAENNLKMLIAPRPDDPVWNQELLPAAAGSEIPASAADLHATIERALKLRPELRAIDQQQSVNDIDQKQNVDQARPALNLVASYTNAGLTGTARTTPDPFTSAIDPYALRINDLSTLAGVTALPPASLGTLGSVGRLHSVQAGLNFEWTARNRQARANVEQSVIESHKLKLQRTQVEQAIVADVRNALQTLATARQRITAAEAGAKAAKEKLESEQRLFANGESTNFLALTRQNEYSDARQRLLAARLDFNKAVARYQQAAGETLEARKLQWEIP
ncbi:MAG TPA: TolC family protein [Bryobacteraceae bacterium]|jgi:HAE1 family hydrophobic/amphiphilic exporter-1